MAVAASKNGNGFAQKALIIGLGVVFTILIGFFGWLALAVIEIRVGVADMKADIESLLETRSEERIDERQQTGERLKELEKGRP